MTDAVEPGAHDGAGAPPLPGTPDAEGWRRLHPFSPFLRGGLAFIVIVGIIIANFRDRLVNLFVAERFDWEGGDIAENAAQTGDVVALARFLADRGLLLAAIGALVGVIAVVIAVSWLAWRFSTYRVGDVAVEARRGIVFRTHRRAPLERIQSVNLQRPLVARALGLTKIDIVTAGQGGKVELAYLGYREAKAVREQILRRAAAQRDALQTETAGAPLADVLAARADDFVDADVDPAAIADDALVKVSVGRLAASIALSWETVTLVALLIGVIVGGAVVQPAIILAVIPIVLIMAGIAFGQFNRGFNFTLSRGADAVRIGSGLTSTNTETIPFGRIHAVEARQPLFWRPLGWWKVRVTTAGHSVAQGGQNSMQNIVLPVGHEADVLRVIDTLLPGVGDEAHEIDGLREGLTGAGTGYLRAGRRAGFVLWWGRSRAGLLVADPDTPEATLRVRRGALTRSLAIMPIVRAQSVQFSRPLVHRALGLASLQAHTVLGPVRMEMRGIDLADARTAFEELAAEVLRVQSADATRRAEGLG
ncbi:MAG: PH domain-containing protein [Leucobacter sp.]